MVYNLKSKKIKNYGFTLIELLVSIAIIITSATVIVAIITASFRGSTKTTVREELRQSGEATLNQITNMIQFADSFEGGVIAEEDEFVPSCQTADVENARYSSITVSKSGRQNIIECLEDDLRINGVSVINTDKATLNQCSFTCSQQEETDPPVIGVSFELTALAGQDSDQTSGIMTFSKTIKMRNR